jgi:hypothetical protein
MALLESDPFDGEAIKELAARESYADAVEALRRVLRHRGSGQASDIVSTLVNGGPSLHFRALQFFSIIPRRTYMARVRRYTLEDAHEFAKNKPNARLALCVLGEPPDPWDKLNRRERAAYCLGQLVEKMRGVP